MKILNLSIEDMAGAGYTLSHALNKTGKHQSINFRIGASNYLNYPTMAEGKYYKGPEIETIVNKADVIVFHSAILPYMTAFHLTEDKLKDKKCLLYFHGSDCRHYGKAFVQQAKEYLQNFTILVSTPDLLEYVPEAVWMPVCRSFIEIKKQYNPQTIDEEALTSFGVPRTKTVLAHAPTNIERKGSALFMKIITELIENDPSVEYQVIQSMSWDSCLHALSHADIYYDQHIIGAYGLASVEAAIFKCAVFCKLNSQVLDVIKEETHIKNPFIQWNSEEEIRERSHALVREPKLRRRFGKIAYNYCQAVHDEEPVVNRFLKIVEGM